MRMLLLALMVLVITAAPRANAASFDCAKASTATEKLICSDRALSQADEALANAFASALGATLDPQNLRAQQLAWIAERNKLGDAAALSRSYQSRTAELQKAAAAWQSFAAEKPINRSASACMAPPEADDDATCAVEASGTVSGAAGGGLRYQLQSYSDNGLRIASAAVVLRSDENGAHWRPVAVAYGEDAHYDAPEIEASPFGALLLLPGHFEGTGNFDASSLFRYGEGKLVDIETQSWQRELARRLPKGLAVWKGVYPDYATMTARTPLWQSSDANCCATGGHATITLALAGNRLVLKELSVTRGTARERSDSAAAAPAGSLCGKPVQFSLDTATFSSGPAADDPAARRTAETRAPPLISKAFAALCAAKTLSPDDIGQRIRRVRIAWAGGADNFAAYFAKNAPGTLLTEWIWQGGEVPDDADIQGGIICAFHPKDKRCADRGP